MLLAKRHEIKDIDIFSDMCNFFHYVYFQMRAKITSSLAECKSENFAIDTNQTLVVSDINFLLYLNKWKRHKM